MLVRQMVWDLLEVSMLEDIGEPSGLLSIPKKAPSEAHEDSRSPQGIQECLQLVQVSSRPIRHLQPGFKHGWLSGQV